MTGLKIPNVTLCQRFFAAPLVLTAPWLLMGAALLTGCAGASAPDTSSQAAASSEMNISSHSRSATSLAVSSQVSSAVLTSSLSTSSSLTAPMSSSAMQSSSAMVNSSVSQSSAAGGCNTQSCTKKALLGWLALPPLMRPELTSQDFAREPINKTLSDALATRLLADHRKLFQAENQAAWKARKLTVGKFTMPFFFSRFGDTPAGERSLFISTHGGGGTASTVNDGQWNNQKHLYDKTMEGLEGIYLAPRAPTNTYNLWFQDHIDEFYNTIIRMAVYNLGVNPNKVYLLGYSAGGDGAYQMGPRMADRWAAVAMMAGHPNDAKPFSLANTPFTIHMGGKDAAYKRNEKARDWGNQLKELAKTYPGLYANSTTIHPGLPHWMSLKDAVALPWMHKYTRDALPARVHWQQNKPLREQLYWVGVPLDIAEAKKPIAAEYTRETNTINIIENYAATLYLWLNDDMLDLDKPVTVQYQGQEMFTGPVARTIKHLHASTIKRGDANNAFSARLTVINNANITVD